MVRVKICGITTTSDALAARDMGADAIGFVFAKSPRQVSVNTVKKISNALGLWIATVGVFVDEAPKRIMQIAAECALSAVQLHGNYKPADMKKFGDIRVIKTFHVDTDFDPAHLGAYDQADAFLFDTKIGNKVGGTGRVFDWNRLKKLSIKKPVIISGGLGPSNVVKAVSFFKPYGVDVSSGVEKSPGKKDLRLVREFIKNAKKIKF